VTKHGFLLFFPSSILSPGSKVLSFYDTPFLLVSVPRPTQYLMDVVVNSSIRLFLRKLVVLLAVLSCIIVPAMWREIFIANVPSTEGRNGFFQICKYPDIEESIRYLLVCCLLFGILYTSHSTTKERRLKNQSIFFRS